jgi:hypothetical protein
MRSIHHCRILQSLKQLGDDESYIIKAVGSAGHVARRWEEIINECKVMIGIFIEIGCLGGKMEASEMNREELK